MNNSYIYEEIYIQFIIPPGFLAMLPLKTCIESPFLNISNCDYIFKPKTKIEFIALVRELPKIVLSAYDIVLDDCPLVKDYERLYKGLYAHLSFNHGYITESLSEFKDDYFVELAKIKTELFELINLIILYQNYVDIPQTCMVSPTQNIWFNCLFDELRGVFLSNGILGKSKSLGKKGLYSKASQSMNHRLGNVTEGIVPTFAKNNYTEEVNNERYILGILEVLAAKNDVCLKRLKYYYKLRKQFFKKYRDKSDYQTGFLDISGNYYRGSIGKNTR